MDKDIEFVGWSFNKNLKRKKPPPEVISLQSDDSDIEYIGVVSAKDKNKLQKKNGIPPPKKVRTVPSGSRSKSESQIDNKPSISHDIKMEIDEVKDFEKETESDYDNIPGYEMRREEWYPPRNIGNMPDITAEVEAALKKLSLGRVSGYERPYQIHTLEEYKGLRGFYKSGPTASSSRGYRSRAGLKQYRGTEFNTPLKHLSPQCTFRMADGCTWISQTGERLLVSSSTPGGGENDSGRNLYNESNTLAYFQTGFRSAEFLPSHYLRGSDPGGDGNPDPRYFDVERACLDPNEPNVFVSAGRDGILTIWNYVTPKIKNLYSNTCEIKYSYVPVKRWGRETYGKSVIHDVVFRKNRMDNRRGIFSAPCRSGNLFIHSYLYDGDQTLDYSHQKLSNKQTSGPNTQIGATLWGDYASSNNLFTCTEVKGASHANVSHYVYDIHSGKSNYALDRCQNGEEICLNPDGSKLALFTQRGHVLDLDLYDARRKNGRSIAHVQDVPCEAKQPNVFKAAWSPDGILLAVATNDHKVRVYDGRFLGSGAYVMEFFHGVQMETTFSITFMEWTTETFIGQNAGLVTGNSGDNRVLLWDTRYSNQEPKVLAEVCSQISVGCLGDPYKREKPLIVGGLDGWVYAYDTSGLVF